jgi:D-amino-acid oxidase
MAHRDTHNLPTPDFTFDPDAPGACIAGVRPYRNSSYRLEAETISNRFFVHNYGHGGAGITLSWGCAAKVRDIIGAYLVGSKEKSVAVLGAGVMGLTAATRMLDLGLDVTIYSDRLPAQTTSAKAGGQWAVSVVEFEGKKGGAHRNHQDGVHDFQGQHRPGLWRA